MNVSLTPELEKLVNEKVKSGLYNSASEVIRESLRLLQEQDELKRFRRDELRREIILGMEQIQRGEYTEIRASQTKEFADQLIREAKDEFDKGNQK